MSEQSLGLIETLGLATAVTAADAAMKSANVTLVGYEFAKGDGMTMVKLRGDVGAVKAAIAAAEAAAGRVGRVVATRVIARPARGLTVLVESRDTVGWHAVAANAPAAARVETPPKEPEAQAPAVLDTPSLERAPADAPSETQSTPPAPDALPPSKPAAEAEPVPAPEPAAKGGPVPEPDPKSPARSRPVRPTKGPKNR
ncbi:microcompartment protein [Rhodobacter sp. TJ_12]|uniref:BMC domain-containing protein n=1 Tax=Rhodobacter sp. TJ_12 TaxID=2029399 RepID=UPI001D9839DE|nr:BMC domain-containing protein [Rhodobacter sp. TJ_12]MBZ4023195.1 microcompartment protein [Rhodobacter sp. TJ_12]